MADNVIFPEQSMDDPKRVEQVYPCRCGVTHRGDYALYAFMHHECFHDDELTWISVPDIAMCPACGKVFHFEEMRLSQNPTSYPCPVCWFFCDEPCANHNICPSCGTEFGLHDVNASAEELRLAWIKTGPKWWSAVDSQPEHWNPYLQLARML